MTLLRIARFALWSSVLVVGTATATLYLVRPAPQLQAAAVVSNGQSSLGKAPYELVDTRGNAFNPQVMTGAPTLLFFGFTQCPDICPTSVADIMLWYEQLGEEAADLRSYFVTIDPERDTYRRIAEYLSWTKRIVGVTGTPEEIAAVAASWGVHYEKISEPDGGYTMDHTSAVYLIDRQGEFVTFISYGEETSVAVEKLRSFLRSQP
ncbi:SCO family protein [Devosia sediminis]|uniref:SCO family protein n=1 Tax=Devosia sediminis TaxID=2798801 RepID=A0A934IX18_9HYPH|nr:SCO family protein [Devosia sediminis]MBJ3784706.1 SCO family protein [Devosia sediminis]